ncbi:MAG: hypothetical protein KJ072_18165 [Verrucomicrobia bacterium]|nr:hypothetical protein [Verrucomicrobiota bacterium]
MTTTRPAPMFLVLVVLMTAGVSGLLPAAPMPEPEVELRKWVEEDWDRQEQRLGRNPASVESLISAVERAEAWWRRRGARSGTSGARHDQARLDELRRAAAEAETLDAEARLRGYRQARWLTRRVALEESGITRQPIVFLQRNRFICQMLHEYMGYFQDYGNVAGGGGVFLLEQPGVSLKLRDVLGGRLSGGNFTTLALSYDASTIYFAYAERSATKPDFYSADRRSFQLFRVAPDGSGLRQLTSGVEDDFDPCPLPDGGLAFMSTRRGGFARCNNAWEPCATYTLHRMDADGANLRALSVHETSEWHPSVMNDGRLVYIRWDYVDRSAANFHGLWTTNPDGTGAASLFGNYTMRINACYQPRPIPGSEKLLFLAGAHHADVGGSLVLLDPRRVGFDPQTGEDRMDAIEVLTPEVCFPESDGWPKSYFHSPWPLSEETMLVSFSFDPLPGMSSGEGRDTRTGLYYFDRWGNLELLYRDASVSSMYPIPLAPRPRPPIIPSTVDHASGEYGEFLLADVRRSFFALPPDRSIREVRVFQLLPKPAPHTANEPRIGHANAENARMLLGSVPVESDGSAYFQAPAGKPLYFQAVDAHGRAVQSMRSAVYLQPGERRSCIGCHETPGSAAEGRMTLALRRPPSRLEPGPDGSQPLSFPRLVQPVLDRHCVACHDGQEGPGRSPLVLSGDPAGHFSRSYENLRPFLRWYEWGGDSISQIATHPGQIGADASPLTRLLEDATHRPALNWTDSERRRLYLWLDANVPFYGTYGREEQLAQREGQAIPPPSFQ